MKYKVLNHFNGSANKAFLSGMFMRFEDPKERKMFYGFS